MAPAVDAGQSVSPGGDLFRARAHWLAPHLVAWPAGSGLEGCTWVLHHSADARLAVERSGISGGESLPLRPLPGGLPAGLRARFPHLADHLALGLGDVGDVEEILQGQFAVACLDPQGDLLAATGLQIPGVLDALHAAAMADASLGATWEGDVPTLRVWAPTSRRVHLLLWDAGATGLPQRITMARDDAGAWSVTGDASWKGMEYHYEVEVFSPETGRFETNSVTDPYSVGLTLNSGRSVLLDLADPQWKPEGWDGSTGPALRSEVDQTIYELHLRDFSIHDPGVPADVRGSYLAFSHDGHGRRHLAELAGAGLNTVALLPTFDIATIEEDSALQTTPGDDLRAFDPDSGHQQARVMGQAGTDAFNWGYDPLHYMVPEGSYASSNAAAGDGRRVAEFRTMVAALHGLGLRVVLDKVFNHTAASGQDRLSVLDRIVPGYYHRLDATGGVETSTCCHNLGTEHAMAQKLMVDSCVLWARHYRVDGFRFDLMGHHSRQNMAAVRSALDGLTVEADGVDGSRITLYGEGWDFGEVTGNRRFRQATQGQLGGTRIGTFNDRLRDGVRGGNPFDPDPSTVRGFTTGGTNPRHTDLVQVGLAGNLADFGFRSQETGRLVTGADVDYHGEPAGYGTHPGESISYVDAHDNETLFDILALKLPRQTPMAHRIRLNHLALATTALSQSPMLWHAGTDLLRSKSLDRDSYDSGDWFNILDFTRQTNGFGRGLPPAEKNRDNWGLMRPLLADASLVPEPSEIRHAAAWSKELLRLRFSSPLFRLGDPHLIRQKVGFPVSGTGAGSAQVIVMHIDDTRGPDVDADLDRIVVVLNASGEPFTAAVPGLGDAVLELHPIQAGGVDPVVRRAVIDAGVASVPALTVAVFVGPSQRRSGG